MSSFLSKYAKAVSALVVAALGWGAVIIASPSKPITAAEWLSLAVGVATALGVYAVPNVPADPPAPAPAPAPVVPPAEGI